MIYNTLLLLCNDLFPSCPSGAGCFLPAFLLLVEFNKSLGIYSGGVPFFLLNWPCSTSSRREFRVETKSVSSVLRKRTKPLVWKESRSELSGISSSSLLLLLLLLLLECRGGFSAVDGRQRFTDAITIIYSLISCSWWWWLCQCCCVRYLVFQLCVLIR